MYVHVAVSTCLIKGDVHIQGHSGRNMSNEYFKQKTAVRRGGILVEPSHITKRLLMGS